MFDTCHICSMAFQWQDEAGKNISLSPRDYYAQYTSWSSALIAQLKQSAGNGKLYYS